MKLIYIANLRLPTEKAYGIQIAKTCEAMADLGCSVILLCPFRISKIKDEFFNYYGIKRNFVFKKIFTLDFYLPGFLNKIAFGLKSLCSALVLVLYALVEGADIFYTRDEIIAYILSFFRKNIIFESHRVSNKRKIFYSRFKKINLKVVVISQGLKDDFINFGIKESSLLVARDGVDLDLFNIEMTKEEARKRYNLPLDKKIVMYSGHLFEWKGADILLEAAHKLEVLFVFVGGTDYDVQKFRQKAEGLNNVLILGHRPYDQIPSLLKAADILVLPNSSKEEISKRYTSPLKLFEYMASQRPIIASDLPSIREVLDENTGYFFKPDDVSSLVGIINLVLNNEPEAREKNTAAFNMAKSFTWQKRAEKILKFIS
ncbi:MAG: glycosyltransferase family 4 protein [bacterium]|nr:glycosyltransferase family 4 protein [bacterium]